MSTTDEAVLIVEGGPEGNESIILSGPTTTFGRQKDSDVVVPEAGVSRRHAEIVETDTGYSLRDLGSTNGTFVNNKKIAEGDHLLKDGDTIRLGASKVSIIFRSQAANTLELTMIQPIVEGLSVEAPELAQAPNETQQPVETAVQPEKILQRAEIQEGVYEGTVRLNVSVEGGMGLVVNFTQQLREKPEFRLLRLSNNWSGGVDVWLALRQPVALRDLLGQIEGVVEVGAPEGRDLSPGSEDAPLTVVLKAENPSSSTPPNSVPCVNCKEPLEPGTAVCPNCRKTQA